MACSLPNLADVRSLIVEDEPIIATALRRFLVGAGAQVTVAMTAKTASSTLEDGTAWDLVLLDQKLPDGDGLDMLDRLDRLPRRPALVAVSAYLQDSKRSLRLQSSRATLLPKPFDCADLYRAVGDALARRDAAVTEPRANATGRSGEYATELVYGSIRAELVTQSVTVHDARVELQPAQFRILAQMLANPGRAFSVRELVEGALRGTHGDGSANIRFQIHSLRRRLGAAGKLIERSSGAYGVGLGALQEHSSD